MKLTLQRQGTFSVGECGDDTTQCGMRGSRKLNYHVSISSTEKQLDEQGFIIDNNEIQQYFDAKFYSVDRFLSCEQIACQATMDLRKLVGARRCKSVAVTIAPVGIPAGLTAEWSA
jgi:hypothetical protein